METTAAEEIIDAVLALVVERYVSPEDAEAIAIDLGAALGQLDIDVADDVFASEVTRALQAHNADKHLRLQHRPDGASSEFGGEDHLEMFAADALRYAGGVNAVEWLADGVGLIRIAPYLLPTQFAEPYLRAAFTLLAGATDLVITHLRDGLGGAPETVAVFCGYLLGPESVHLQDMEERGQPTRQYWSVPAQIQLTGRVRVLTSARTFSGCEELAYDLQALSRAVVVGESTRGGAHPVEAFAVSQTLELHLPIARSINAITGTNWEGIGVHPDLPCPAPEALAVALEDLRTT